MAKILKKILILLIVACFFTQSTGTSYDLRPMAKVNEGAVIYGSGIETDGTFFIRAASQAVGLRRAIERAALRAPATIHSREIGFSQPTIDDELEHTSTEKTTKVLLGFLSEVRDESRIDDPIAISQLAATLKREFDDSIDVSKVHYLLEPGIKGFIDRIKREKPNIIGLSITYQTLGRVEKIMEYVNSLPEDQRPLVVLGNILATYNAEFLLSRFPNVMICIAEGEDSIRDIVRYYRGEISKSEITNLAFVHNNRTIFTERKRTDFAVSGIPQRDMLSHIVSTGGTVYLETSRGCPFNCSICARVPFLGKKGWHGRPLDDVMKDFIEVCKHGARFINIVDEDLFAGGAKRIIKMADRIIELKTLGKIPKETIFSTSVSTRQVYKKSDSEENNSLRIESLKRLKEAGLDYIFIGTESGSRTQLRRYAKAATVLENERAIAILGRIGIDVVPGFIMFDPHVTIEELRENLAFLRQTGIDKSITYPLKSYIPMKGARYTQQLIKDGLIDPATYNPDTLCYEYMYEHKEVARCLRSIKDWEESQNIFLWKLKLLMRSSKLGALSQQEREIIKTLVAEQTMIITDYLDDILNTVSEIEKEQIDRKYSNRLLGDMIRILHYIERHNITIDTESLTKTIYKGILREIIRIHYPKQLFSIDDIHTTIKENFNVELDINRCATIMASFLKQGRIGVSGKQYQALNGFWKYREIPYNDLPRPSYEEVAMDIANNIIHTPVEDVAEAMSVRVLAEQAPIPNEMIFVLKPGGTFNIDVLNDLLLRIHKRKYHVKGIRIFMGEEIKRRGLFDKEYGYLIRVAKEGKKLFSKDDMKRVSDIYNTSQLQLSFGVEFNEIKIIPAYSLKDKYGLTEEDVVVLWERGYQEGAYRRDDVCGINKVGASKYVLMTSDPRVEGGKPFLLVNGLCIQMKMLSETEGEKTVVFLLRGVPDRADSWKQMREEFLGDKSPQDSPIASIRHDSWVGRMGITEKVESWKNIAHLSSSPLEGMLDGVIWFNMSITQTAFGRVLYENGYTEQEMQCLLTDPDITINGINRSLFDWMEKMDVKEALQFITRIAPPFYNKEAMPTLDFDEYNRLRILHDQGLLSMASNEMPSEQIKPARLQQVEICSDLSPDESAHYDVVGQSLIRQGKVAQVLIAGGTSGRWFGYDVPESERIRFLAEAYSFDGKLRTFAELKFANNRWAASQADGKIPIWIMTSELSNETIHNFLKANGYFGFSKNDVHFYTQGAIPRMNPTKADLITAFPDKMEQWIDEHIEENGGEGGIFRFRDGAISRKPIGHFDVIASLFLSHELLRMVDAGIQFIHFSDATNLGTNIDPLLIGMLAESGKGIIHMLARKNVLYSVGIEGQEQKQLLVIREEQIVYSSLSQNMVPILEAGEVVGVRDKASGQKIAVSIEKKLEKAGTFANAAGVPQIVEGFRFPKNYDHEQIPYLSTVHQIIRVESLLDLFGVSVDGYRDASIEELIEKASRVSTRLNTYLEVKQVIDEDLGKTRLAVQFSRLSGDLTSLLSTEYVLIDRDAVGTQCGFIPFKKREDLEVNRQAVVNALSKRVIFTSAIDMLPTVITIDGLVASGKTTVAKRLADELGYIYIEYSALFRAAGFIALRDNLGVNDADGVMRALNTSKIEIHIVSNRAHIFIDGVDITDWLYEGDDFERRILEKAAHIAQIPRVRNKMAALARETINSIKNSGRKVIVVGRVAGKELLPNADMKIFLTASDEIRAQRVLLKSGQDNAGRATNEALRRDAIDTQRLLSPALPANDAIVIDTSAMDLGQAVRFLSSLIADPEVLIGRYNRHYAPDKVVDKHDAILLIDSAA